MGYNTGLTVQQIKNGTRKISTSDQPFFIIFLISNDIINSIIHHFFFHIHDFRLQKNQVDINLGIWVVIITVVFLAMLWLRSSTFGKLLTQRIFSKPVSRTPSWFFESVEVSTVCSCLTSPTLMEKQDRIEVNADNSVLECIGFWCHSVIPIIKHLFCNKTGQLLKWKSNPQVTESPNPPSYQIFFSKTFLFFKTVFALTDIFPSKNGKFEDSFNDWGILKFKIRSLSWGILCCQLTNTSGLVYCKIKSIPEHACYRNFYLMNPYLCYSLHRLSHGIVGSQCLWSKTIILNIQSFTTMLCYKWWIQICKRCCCKWLQNIITFS